MTTINFWQAIATTPWWIYILFTYLFFVALSARKPRKMPVRALYIMPAFIICLFIIAIVTHVQLTLNNSLSLAAMLLVGTFLGWLHFRLMGIKAVKDEKKLYVKGSWLLVLLIPALMIARIHYGDALWDYAQLLSQPENSAWLLGFYGLFTGLFLGRILYSRRCMRMGPFHQA